MSSSSDIPIVVTGGSVMLEYTEGEFQDDGHAAGRKKLKSRDPHKKIVTIVIKDDRGNEVHRYAVAANGKFEVVFQGF